MKKTVDEFVASQCCKSEDGKEDKDNLDAKGVPFQMGEDNLDFKGDRTKPILSSEPSFQIDYLEKSWFLHSARCNLGQMKNLLEKDYELLNKKDYFTGYAALHWAAKKGRIDVVEWLVQQHADLGVCSNGGHSPLHISTMHNQTTIVKKLINDFKADINIRDYSGRKARHYASKDLPLYVQRALEKTPSITDLHVDPTFRCAVPSMMYLQESAFASEKDKIPGESLKKKRRKISVPHSFRAIKNKKQFSKKETLDGVPGNLLSRKSVSSPDVFNQITYPYRFTSAEI